MEYKQRGSSICQIGEDRYVKKAVNKMRTFDNLVCNVENTVSSIPKIHVSLDGILARLASFGEEARFTTPQVNYNIINAMRKKSGMT